MGETVKKFYQGMNEYKLSLIHTKQGHYLLFKNLGKAIDDAKNWAREVGDPVLVQLWKPKRGKRIYIVNPSKYVGYSKKDLIQVFDTEGGYDIRYIKPKKYVMVQSKM